MDSTEDLIYLTAPNLRHFTTSLLAANRVPAHHAASTAEALVLADLRGVDTHGTARLPSYMARVRAGVLDPTAEPSITEITPAVALVDAHNALGFIAARLAVDRAVSIASTLGIGLVGVRNSNHFGMSAWVVQRAVDAGMLALVFTNSSPALPVYGGRERLVGVSPLACGAPSDAKDGTRPFVLDMAPSVAARGKIYKAARRGEEIPPDWALDEHGNPTTDASAALKGTMLPMGGPKGSALAIMMDVFSGVLTGARFGGDVTGPYDPSREAGVGHFVVVLRPDLFVTADEFRERMKVLYERVVGSQRMPGVDRIYFPGEIEQETHERREREGIPFKVGEVDALDKEADLVGIARVVRGV